MQLFPGAVFAVTSCINGPHKIKWLLLLLENQLFSILRQSAFRTSRVVLTGSLRGCVVGATFQTVSSRYEQLICKAKLLIISVRRELYSQRMAAAIGTGSLLHKLTRQSQRQYEGGCSWRALKFSIGMFFIQQIVLLLLQELLAV